MLKSKEFKVQVVNKLCEVNTISHQQGRRYGSWAPLKVGPLEHVP